MRAAVAIAGVLLTIWVASALVQVMLVPRPPRSILSRGIGAILARVTTAPVNLFRSYKRQDRWLAAAAPLSVLLELIVYACLFIVTTGLVVYGTTQLSWTESFYQSGATFTTLGIVEPVNVESAIATFVAAFLGLVVIAVFIGYLMSLSAAYVGRESGMARMSMLAGEPAWGPLILARGQRLGMHSQDNPKSADWTSWTSDVRMNERVSPLLSRMRSPTARRHWVITVLAVLDAVALRVCLNPKSWTSADVQLLTEGTITLGALARLQRPRNWDVERAVLAAVRNVPSSFAPDQETDVGITRDEWDRGIAVLRGSGYPLPADLEESWLRFCAIRSIYCAPAYDLALRLYAVPAPWSGPRSQRVETIWPERLDSEGDVHAG